MCINTINEMKQVLVNAGYEKELNDILFIEDFEPLELEPIEFELIEFDNYEIEPIEFDELY